LIVKKRIENLNNFKMLFWESDVSAIDLDKYDFYIIQRFLEYGDDQEVKWMFDHYTNERIKECLYNHPGLSRRRALFWKAYFKGLIK